MPKKNKTRKYNRGEIGAVYSELEEIMSHSSGISPATRTERLEQLLDWAQKRRTHVLFGNMGASSSTSSSIHKLRNAEDMVSLIQHHLNSLKPSLHATSPVEAARAASPYTHSPSLGRTTRRASSNASMALQLQLEEIPQMRVVDLKAALRAAGQLVSGNKSELVTRYSEFLVKKSK